MAQQKWLNSDQPIAAVRQENLAFFIDQTGRKLDIGDFAFTANFSCNWACINLGGTRIQNPPGVIGGNFRFIDTKGNYLPLRFDEASHFCENLAIINSGNRAFIINQDGELVADRFLKVLPFSDGLAAATKINELGYLNKTGEFEFRMRPGDVLHPFIDGIAKIERAGQAGFINLSGQWLIEPSDHVIFPFSERKAVYEEHELYGFLDDSGEKLTEAIYEDCADFKEDLAAVKIDGKWGFINAAGLLVIEPKFDLVRNFSDQMAAFMQNGKVGYLNASGKVVISPMFEAAYEFQNGFAPFQREGKLGFIDHRGSVAIEPTFDRVNSFVNPCTSNPQIRIH
jgi:hypothetical protein